MTAKPRPYNCRIGSWPALKLIQQAYVGKGFSDTFAVIGIVPVLAALAVMLKRKVKGAAGGAPIE